MIWVIIEKIDRAKRLHATWRILVGVWAPKGWDLSGTALSEYMSPKIPPPNPWISGAGEGETRGREKGGRRPPSRRLVRHVLRARVEALNGLGELFDSLGSGETAEFLGKRGARIPKKDHEGESWE